MSRPSLRRLGLMASSALIVAATTLVATSGFIAAGAGTPRTLTWGILSNDTSLDPALIHTNDAGIVASGMCNSLLRFGAHGQLEPELAASWKQTSPTSYVYDLVHNARFWDGNPVTATDVAFSINRIADAQLASPLLPLWQSGEIKEAVASGKWRVTIELYGPDPIAPELVATPVGQVVEESVVQKYGAAFGSSPKTFMCSGPFRPELYVDGSITVLDAVPHYWDSAASPSIKTITFKQVSDAQTLVNDLRSGALDGTYDLPERDVHALTSDSRVKIDVVPYAGDSNFISANVEKGPLANADVRRALSLAVSRQLIASLVDGAAGRALKSVESPALFTQDPSIYLAAYNALPVPVVPSATEATKLIAQAHAKGETITIVVESSPSSGAVSAALKKAGSSIGLRIKIVTLTALSYEADNESGVCPRPFNAIVTSWQPGFPAPSAELIPPLSNNYSDASCYFSKDFNTLRAAWASTANGSVAQANATVAIMKLLTRDDVYIPLYADPLIMVEPSTLSGYTPTQVFSYQDMPDMVKFGP